MSNSSIPIIDNNTIVHKIKYKDRRERLDLISSICKAHPKGKKLVIKGTKGNILYEISAKESVF